MRLLNIVAVIDRDKAIQGTGHETGALKELDDQATSYAILSHRWGNKSEVSYKEMIKLTKMVGKEREEVRQRDGYKKIIRTCEQAMTDGYEWLWIDTCCIDKRSSAELSEAINSMYRWYSNAKVCYVYLNDVEESTFPTKQDFGRFGKTNGWPEWFSRGWTLQELIAPKEVEFFNKRWESLGTKRNLTSTLEKITRIPGMVLRDEQVLRTRGRPCIAHIMSWAADRKTTRVEDRAYSLLGLFGVNMWMPYGVGWKAFQQLQLEIIRISNDHSIFAWNPKGQLGEHRSILADDPSCFRGCHDIERVDPPGFVEELKEYMYQKGLGVVRDPEVLEPLLHSVHSPDLCRFDITNLGIQVSLPVAPNRDTPPQHFKAFLPCRDRYGNLITIDLESCEHSFARCLNTRWFFDKLPGFGPRYLHYSHDHKEKSHNLRLHDTRALRHGFTRRGAFPCEVANDTSTVTLSYGANSLIVLVYANSDARCRFAVGIGYYLGKAWARIVCDECSANQAVWSSWPDFAKQVYHILWNEPIDESYFRFTSVAIKDTHLPRSIWDARIVCGCIGQDYADFMIDIKQCPGSCTGPREWTNTSWFDEPSLPWTSQRHGSHHLELGGQFAWLHECSGQGIITRPLAWPKEPACAQRRKGFRNIRRHFYSLANLHYISGTEACHETADEWTTNAVIDFSAMFGLEYLKNLVGEITFFAKLPSIMESRLREEVSVGATGRTGSPVHPSNLPRASSVIRRNLSECRLKAWQNPCFEVVLEKCEALGKGSPHEERKTQREVEYLSQTLSVGLLDRICISFLDVSEGRLRTGEVGCTDHDSVNVHSAAQEIVALRVKLQAAEDEDERRALEEDITGKILWFYWRAICLEVDQLLESAVALAQGNRITNILGGLRGIAEIIKRGRRINPDDDIAHLQRIMLDAGADVSRHKLWLAARAANKTSLSEVFRSKPIPSTQETASSKSSEVPCTSMIQQLLDTSYRRKRRRI